MWRHRCPASMWHVAKVISDVMGLVWGCAWGDLRRRHGLCQGRRQADSSLNIREQSIPRWWWLPISYGSSRICGWSSEIHWQKKEFWLGCSWTKCDSNVKNSTVSSWHQDNKYVYLNNFLYVCFICCANMSNMLVMLDSANVGIKQKQNSYVENQDIYSTFGRHPENLLQNTSRTVSKISWI